MQTETQPKAHGLALPALRAVRERRGLSQTQLAEQSGVTRATITSLEHGASRARPSNALRLAQALRVALEVLTGEEPLVEAAPGEVDGVFSLYFAAAMRHVVFRQAGEQQRVYAAIPGIPGLWARGETREEAERDLREALEWFTLTCVFEHRPLPAFDGVSLEIVQESKGGREVLYPVVPPSDESFLNHVDDQAQQ